MLHYVAFALLALSLSSQCVTFLSAGMTLLLICCSTLWEAAAMMESTSPLNGVAPKLARICEICGFQLALLYDYALVPGMLTSQQ